MANRNPKRRTTTASKILREAFELFYVRTTKNRAESTVIENRKRLKNFLEFIKGRDSIDRLNQDTINEYRDYLIKKRLSANRINTCGGTICRLINFLSISSEFKKYGRKFESVTFRNVEDQRHKNEKKSQALEDWQAEKIRNAKGLTEKEEFYRDCFVMQLETGVRKSDVEKLFNGQYDTTEENGKTALIIKTKKSKRQQIRAIIVCNETISALQEKYREKKVKINESEYNKNLKSIAKKAGLTHEIEYQESKGEGTKKKREPQCDAFTSHWGRHTFITKKCREGYSPESVIKLTGHTSEKMVREIYSHLKPNDIAKQVLQTEIERENEEKNISDSGAYEFIARQSIEIDKLKSKIKKDESLFFMHNIQAQRAKIAENRANDILKMWKHGLSYEDMERLNDEADTALMEG